MAIAIGEKRIKSIKTDTSFYNDQQPDTGLMDMIFPLQEEPRTRFITY